MVQQKYNGLKPPSQTNRSTTHPSLSKQLSCLDNLMETIESASINRTGEHVGKVTDEEVIRELEALKTIRNNIQLLRQKQKKGVTMCDLKQFDV
jgi:hypothetical protein